MLFLVLFFLMLFVLGLMGLVRRCRTPVPGPVTEGKESNKETIELPSEEVKVNLHTQGQANIWEIERWREKHGRICTRTMLPLRKQ